MLVLAPPRPGELATTLASLGPHATASEGATPLVVRHTLCGHAGAVRAVCWAHDDRFLVSCAADGSVYVWDAITGQRQDSLNVSDRLNRPQPYSALALAQPSTQTTCEDAQEPQRLCCAGPDGKLTQLTWTPQPSSRGASVSSTTDFAGILLRKFLRVVHIFRSTEWSLDRSRAASRDRERERERERERRWDMDISRARTRRRRLECFLFLFTTLSYRFHTILWRLFRGNIIRERPLEILPFRVVFKGKTHRFPHVSLEWAGLAR